MTDLAALQLIYEQGLRNDEQALRVVKALRCALYELHRADLMPADSADRITYSTEIKKIFGLTDTDGGIPIANVRARTA